MLRLNIKFFSTAILVAMMGACSKTEFGNQQPGTQTPTVNNNNINPNTNIPPINNNPNIPPITNNPNIPSNAVTRGSFTIWANPRNPAPRQNYKIMIQVQLPSNVPLLSYSLADLRGYIKGTDGYGYVLNKNSQQRNQFERRDAAGNRVFPVSTTAEAYNLPDNEFSFGLGVPTYNIVGSSTVLIGISIPGGEKLVKDTIKISSQLLNEDHPPFELIFQ